MSGVPSMVVVLSTPRSGSSWTATVLGRHPDLRVYSAAGGDSLAFYLVQPFRSLSPLASDDAGRSRWAAGATALKGRLLRRYLRTDEAAVPVVASPTAAAFLGPLLSAHPDAKVVRVTRDPLDTVASLHRFLLSRAEDTARHRVQVAREIGTPLPWLRAGAHLFHRLRWSLAGQPGYLGVRPRGFRSGAGSPTLEYVAGYYLDLEAWMAEEIAGLPPSRLHHLRYEDLVLDTEATLRSLCAFIGTPAPAGFLAEACSSVSVAAVGGHRRLLDDDQVRRVRRVLDERAGPPS